MSINELQDATKSCTAGLKNSSLVQCTGRKQCEWTLHEYLIVLCIFLIVKSKQKHDKKVNVMYAEVAGRAPLQAVTFADVQMRACRAITISSLRQ